MVLQSIWAIQMGQRIATLTKDGTFKSYGKTHLKKAPKNKVAKKAFMKKIVKK